MNLVADVKYNPDEKTCRVKFTEEGKDMFGISAFTTSREAEALALYESGKYSKIEECFEELVMTSLLGDDA